MLALCTIDGCGKRHMARGWCAAHYERWRKHGDPHGGRTPNGEGNRYLQEVVLAYEGNECLPWPFATNRGGYGWMRHDGSHQLVSRIVCAQVHGAPPTPKHEAAHSCGNGHFACVTKGHLMWKTPAENAEDKITHGTTLRGDKNPIAKLSVPAVQEIRSLKGAISQRAVSRMFGVSCSLVCRIQSGKAWAWLC